MTESRLEQRSNSKRVPVVAQLTATECAAACLTMILRYFGRTTRLSECRERCGSGRDGATALALARAARSFRLTTRVFSSPTSDLSGIALPAIAHWRFNHFLVVERFERKFVDVVDPASGRRRLTRSEFDLGFTGVVLTFEPALDFERTGVASAFQWRDYFRKLITTPGLRAPFVQILVASLVLQLVGLAFPIATKVIVDEVLPRSLDSALGKFGLAMVVCVAAQALVGYLRQSLTVFVQALLDTRIMVEFFAHLLSLPYRFFQQRTTGDILMRLSSSSLLREVLTSQTTSALFDGALVITYLGLLLVWSPAFAGLALGVGALQVALALLTTRTVYATMQREIAAQADSQSYAVEALASIATVKASGAEQRVLERWHALFKRQVDAAMARGRTHAVIEVGMTLLRSGAPLLLLFVGTSFVLDSSMSLGSMLALSALAASFLAPLTSLVQNGQNLQLVGAHLDRIADVLEAVPEPTHPGATPLEPFAGRLDLDHVSFRYDVNGPLVVQDVSISVAAGEKVALVGATGSGKSTLLLLCLGLHVPTEGSVRFDGRLLSEIDLKDLRRRCGVVMQDVTLFAGSIRQNIAFNDPTLSLDAVREAAALAAIDDEIMAMPMQYETVLSEGGSGLSGGQKQRLALARALAARPRVLFLDEATSHLDVVTEAQVDANLDTLSCTRVVVAHRLSTIRNASRIIVLEGGRVVEQGVHAELLARGGAYAALFGQQLAS